jgi:flagellar transcriptional activator FlhD
MRTAELLNEIKELNLAYLMLAQQMVRGDRDAAMLRLGISEEVADLLADLTAGQVLKMAASQLMLCRFRFDDRLLLDLLADHKRESGVSHLHAAIVAAGRPVEALA